MDFLSIIIAVMLAVLAQGLSTVWYSKYMLGGVWRKALRRKAGAKIPRKMHVVSLASLIVSSIIYSIVVNVFGLYSWIDLLFFSGFMFVAFWLPGKVTHVYYAGQSKTLIWIDGAFYLLAYTLFALGYAFI